MTDTLQQRIQQQQRLKEVRMQLLRLHKLLLEMERVNYEQTYGPVSRGALLQLVINHEQFAWLHQLSRLVLQIDDLLYADEPVSPETIADFMAKILQLLTVSNQADFAPKYDQAIQDNPDAGLLHASILDLLAS